MVGGKEFPNVLGSVGAVVHQEELNVLGVVDEESLVAGGHHVAGLLVGSITDLGPVGKKRKKFGQSSVLTCATPRM